MPTQLDDDDSRLPWGHLDPLAGQKSKRRKRRVFLIVGALIVVVGPLAYLWLTDFVRGKAVQSRSANSLKQIGIGIQIYHEGNGGLPPAAIRDKNGKPLLSWRVAILPYMEQYQLYIQFRLNEPWDSPHNKELLSKMPKIYASPYDEEATREFKTYYRVFTGKGTLFPNGGTLTFDQATDGLDNVVMVVEAGEAVPWTKPDELEYDPNKPLPQLGGVLRDSDTFQVVMANGDVRKIKRSVSEQSIRAAIICNDGIKPGPDW